MSKEDKLPSDVVADLDQFDAMMTNMAPIISSYYKALLTNGIPEPLAHQLTIEWHNIFWLYHFPGSKDRK